MLAWLRKCAGFIRLSVPYLYHLRVQLLTLATLVALPYVALCQYPALLRGLFDVRWLGMMYVTFCTLLASWTVMVTVWLVLLYGCCRLGLRRLHVRIPHKWPHSFFFAFFALPMVIGAFWQSIDGGSSSWLPLLGGALLGLLFALAFLWIGGKFEAAEWFRSPSLPMLLGRGYTEPAEGGRRRLREGHHLALWSFALCLFAYIVIGKAKFDRIGYDPGIPTLAYVLLFVIVCCWFVSALTFFLDRYRVPILVPLVVWGTLTSQLAESDHYFHVLTIHSEVGVGLATVHPVSPADVIRAKRTNTVVVVAATGGGIQAAAWTARVLTGLEEESRTTFPQDPKIFGESVRLISSVSGGSVGAMYLLNEYDPRGAGLAQNLENVVRRAEASSLDDIAWGLVYPDFRRILLPNTVPKELDRGQALEAALTREPQNGPSRLSQGLSTWRDGVTVGTRPAVVFNATITDTGERLLLATTDLKAQFGRRSLSDPNDPQYRGKDVAVVTAARLSASFPYVSPAARPDLDGPQFHVVDGGYTDNYGMATLVEWLDEALSAADNPVRRVLVVEIRASPSESKIKLKNKRGWFYQSYAPIATMLHTRDTGQLSHNEEDLCLVERLGFEHKVDIQAATFEFPSDDAPLSWHLSPREMNNIEQAWSQQKSGAQWQRVRDYLTAKPSALNAPACHQ